MAPTGLDGQTFGLLQALNRVANETVAVAGRLASAPEWERFGVFRSFRQKTRECEALTNLLEHSLETVAFEAAHSIRVEFERLDGRLLVLSIDTSRAFAGSIRSGLVPLWSDDLIVAELQALDSLVDRVHDRPPETRDAASLSAAIAETKLLLTEVLTRIPRLENFDMLPGPPKAELPPPRWNDRAAQRRRRTSAPQAPGFG
jgi:hypothetical protein